MLLLSRYYLIKVLLNVAGRSLSHAELKLNEKRWIFYASNSLPVGARSFCIFRYEMMVTAMDTSLSPSNKRLIARGAVIVAMAAKLQKGGTEIGKKNETVSKQKEDMGH
jgi:hypothetical protein